MTKVDIQILSPGKLSSRKEGQLIFDLWKNYLPAVLPEKYGNWEPLKAVFDPNRIEPALNAWQWPFLAKRKIPRMDSSIWMRFGPKLEHASWCISIDKRAIDENGLLRFLRAASVALKADFACITILTPNEISRGREQKTVLALDKAATRFAFSIASRDLQRRVPDLYWATILGAPYLELLGKERMLVTPIHNVEVVSGDTVLFQLTDSLAAFEYSPERVEDDRKKAKVHLGASAFFEKTLEASGQYATPKFTFCQ
jgi:hypothetical protein